MTIQEKVNTKELATQSKKIIHACVLFLAVIGLNNTVYADVAHTVTCKDGTKVEVGGTDYFGNIACIDFGGRSGVHKRKGSATRAFMQVPKATSATQKKHLPSARRSKIKPQLRKLSPVNVKRSAKQSLRAKGYNISGKTVSFRNLPIKAQKAIEDSFNKQMRGRTHTYNKAGQAVKLPMGNFAVETRGGTALDCDFNRDAVGCWSEAGNFTGCFKVGDEWSCKWNEPIGTSDD